MLLSFLRGDVSVGHFHGGVINYQNPSICCFLLQIRDIVKESFNDFLGDTKAHFLNDFARF